MKLPVKYLLVSIGFSLVTYYSAADASTYQFTTLDITGSKSGTTMASGLNNNGDVTGVYADNVGNHGFILNGSTLTTLDDPKAQNNGSALTGWGTYALSNNNLGYVVGDYYNATSRGANGFLYHGGVYTDILYGTAGTTAVGINDSNQIVGFTLVTTDKATHGYVDDSGAFTLIDDPNAGNLLNQGTLPDSINNAGVVVGNYVDTNNQSHGFTESKGVFTTLDDPNASAGEFPVGGTYLSHINNNGVITGTYINNAVMHAFIYDQGVFTDINDPHLLPTAATPNTNGYGVWLGGINDANQLVGWTSDSSGVNGFTADLLTLPLPSPGLLFAGTLALAMGLRGKNRA